MIFYSGNYWQILKLISNSPTLRLLWGSRLRLLGKRRWLLGYWTIGLFETGLHEKTFLNWRPLLNICFEWLYLWSARRHIDKKVSLPFWFCWPHLAAVDLQQDLRRSRYLHSSTPQLPLGHWRNLQPHWGRNELSKIYRINFFIVTLRKMASLKKFTSKNHKIGKNILSDRWS